MAVRSLVADQNGFLHISPSYSNQARSFDLLRLVHLDEIIEDFESSIRNVMNSLGCDSNWTDQCQQLQDSLENGKKDIWNKAIRVLFATANVAFFSAGYSIHSQIIAPVATTWANFSAGLGFAVAYVSDGVVKVKYGVNFDHEVTIYVEGIVYGLSLDRNPNVLGELRLAVSLESSIKYYRIIEAGEVEELLTIPVTQQRETKGFASRLASLVEDGDITLQPHDAVFIVCTEDENIAVTTNREIGVVFRGAFYQGNNFSFVCNSGELLVFISGAEETQLTITRT